jgi:hypothetical protein
MNLAKSVKFSMNISANVSFLTGILELVVLLGQHTLATFFHTVLMRQDVLSTPVLCVSQMDKNIFSNNHNFVSIFSPRSSYHQPSNNYFKQFLALIKSNQIKA